jgi:hypothetical protein
VRDLLFIFMKTLTPEWLGEVPGASGLFEWFGYWPDFHDSEVLSILLNRSGSSIVRVHAFEMTNQVDEKGYFVLQKHVVVSFLLDNVLTCDLKWFNNQNAMSEIALLRTDEGFELSFEPAHGVSGTVAAQRVRIEMEPGIPNGSQYRRE